MSQTVPPLPSSPEHPFSSERQTPPLTFTLLVSDGYMLDLDKTPTGPLPAMPKVSYRVQK